MKIKKANGNTNLVISFNNEKLIPLLYGDLDRNLHRIESNLGVSLNGRGRNIEISGKEVKLAHAVLNDLYNQVKNGFEIGYEEVDAAIRMNNDRNSTLKNNDSNIPLIKTSKKTVKARTHHQNDYINVLNNSELTFGIGPAGTGKTYIPVAHAVSKLESSEIEKIIISRPAVEAGEKLGFLPGDLKEKVDPYLRPIYDSLEDVLSYKKLEKYMQLGVIEIAPLAFMRGRTLSNAYIILDEAQNTTVMQMKMFLTRLGFNSRMVITGDITQIDLPNNLKSGLPDALRVTKLIGKGVGHVYFDDKDVVRHPLVQEIVKAYERK